MVIQLIVLVSVFLFSLFLYVFALWFALGLSVGCLCVFVLGFLVVVCFWYGLLFWAFVCGRCYFVAGCCGCLLRLCDFCLLGWVRICYLVAVFVVVPVGLLCGCVLRVGLVYMDLLFVGSGCCWFWMVLVSGDLMLSVVGLNWLFVVVWLLVAWMLFGCVGIYCCL